MTESRTTSFTGHGTEFRKPSLPDLAYICAYVLMPYVLAGILLAA